MLQPGHSKRSRLDGVHAGSPILHELSSGGYLKISMTLPPFLVCFFRFPTLSMHFLLLL
jgi:hypothetical protein